MTVDQLLEKLNTAAESVEFAEVIQTIDDSFEFVPTAFQNGETKNEAGQNNGSCKIFAFGKLQAISEDKVLHLFGDFYRKDVLENPEGSDHQNIRNFMQKGWQGVFFEGDALIAK